MKATEFLFGILVSGAVVFGACGGSTENPASGGGDSGNCKSVGVSCGGNSDCCTGLCEPTAKVCARGSGGGCAPAGQACQVGPDCCTYACLNGTCSNAQCTADNEACTTDGACCGGKCSSGKCTPLAGCKTSGNPCSSAGECCSQYCSNGFCSTPSYCTTAGDACTSDLECCGGKCSRQNGATLGVCQLAPASGAGGCLSAGEPCSGGAIYMGGPLPVCGGECCSRACFPYAPTGVLICQPPSGCHPTGETCAQDGDCCGSAGLPNGDTANIHCSKEAGNPLGRCDQGNACTPAGGICRLQTIQCNANANCCAGNVLQKNTCKQDNLGIPRCLVGEIDCTDPSGYIGKGCSTSADCCNLPCVPNPSGNPPLICGGTQCVPTGGSCTTTADCCAGIPCIAPPGATKGTCNNPPPPPDGGTPCAAYGQQCKTSGDCCNGVPCTSGFCVIIVN